MSSRSEALLDHIADFLKFISNTQSYWLTLITSYDHGCHLANRFRLDQKEYEAVLIVAGLANYTRFGFQIKANMWRKFLGGHRFVVDGCTIELAQKRLDLNAYINGIMRALLAELIELLGKDYELNVIDSSNNTQLTYVRVPKTSSNRSFHNSKEWLDVAIKVAGTKHGGTFEAANRISNHLLRFYRDSVMAACETQKLPVSKPMTATQFSSMMNAARVRNKEFVKKLEKARVMLRDQMEKLKTMRTSKVKDQQSIETKIFKVLKEIGVELSSYHGRSLNGKDIRKVMTNACYVFDTFAAIFKGGKRPNCSLSDTHIDALCLQFREVFVLWDGAFSLARTINPTEIDISTYSMYVKAAVKGSKDLRCTFTPKVHLMLNHVAEQMTNTRGGLGGKMEDWLERLHQDGKRERLQFRTVQNPIARAHAREIVHTRNIHPDVISQTNNINEGNKRNLAELKTDLMGMRRKRQRDVGRYEAMQYFMQDDTKRLLWSAPLFNDGKVDSYDGAIAEGGIFVS